MRNPIERYRPISAAFTERLHGVQADQWSTPVPSCPDWDVTALVTHLIGTHRLILSLVDRNHDAPPEGADLVAAWDLVNADVLDGLEDRDTALEAVQSPFGPTTFEGIVRGLLCGDTLIHTWDLARATDQDATLDPEACAEQFQVMEPMDDKIRVPGFFGDKIPSGPDDDAQTRLLLFVGRQP
ncbi:MAG: TIGR03086 family protein [Actinobacteria bacterium]|nr:TIGR03086 family protein [Actinomycetota bacterium]